MYLIDNIINFFTKCFSNNPNKIQFNLSNYYKRCFGQETSISGKFTATKDRILFIVGQDYGTVNGFLQEVLPNPLGTTSYTNISTDPYSSLWGLDDFINYGAGRINASGQLELVPNSALCLGLYLVNNLEPIVQNQLDHEIEKLADWIKSKIVPIYLRIGYEFDLIYNNYDPELYIQTFRKIAHMFRDRNVRNCALVWQSAALTRERDFTDWYPGDDVVDWIGSSWFIPEIDMHEKLVNFARAVNKPLMICEAAPQGYDVKEGIKFDIYTNEILESGLSGEDIWKAWYERIFDFIYRYKDVIRGFAYINTPWKLQPMWRTGENGFWGDSRIQKNSYIEDKFKEIIQRDQDWLLSNTNDVYKNFKK